MEFPLPCLIPGGYTLVHHCIQDEGRQRMSFNAGFEDAPTQGPKIVTVFPGWETSWNKDLCVLKVSSSPEFQWCLQVPDLPVSPVSMQKCQYLLCFFNFSEHGSSAKTIQNNPKHGFTVLKWSCSNFDDPRAIPIYWPPTSCHQKKGSSTSATFFFSLMSSDTALESVTYCWGRAETSSQIVSMWYRRYVNIILQL